MRGATEAYGKSADCWSEIQSLAEKLAEPSLKQTSRARRCNLAVSMLDSKEFSVLAAGGGGPPRIPVLVAGTPGKIDAGELEEIIRVLSLARHRYPLQVDAEARDVPLISEALALLHRIRGDLLQHKADVRFRGALKILQSKPEPSAGDAAGVSRLRFLLRDFKGAWDHSLLHAGLIESLDRDSLLRHLGLVARAGEFLGYRQKVAALNRKITSLGGKAEQPPRPRASLARLPVGSRADLVLLAGGLVRLLSACELPARERSLLALMASLPALELGEYGLVKNLLGAGQDELQYDWLAAAVSARAALACERLGDYEGALHFLKHSRRLASAMNATETFVARLDLNLATTLLALGQPLAAGEKARALVRSPSAAAAVRIKARILMGGALYERARSDPQRLEQASRVFAAVERELKDPENSGLTGALELSLVNSIHRANVLRRQAAGLTGPGRETLYREAIGLQDAAMRQASEAGAHHLSAIAASNLGELYAESGRHESAVKFTSWALKRASETGQFETEWRCHWYLARIADAQGKLAEADASLTEAARLVDSYRARILDAESKAGFMTDKLDLYRYLVRREISRGRPARALELAERSRARALVESLGWRFVTLADPDSSELYQQYVSLNGREDSARRGRALKVLGVKGKRESFDALRLRMAEVKKRIKASAASRPLLGLLVDGAPAAMKEIISELDEDTALLEFFSLGDRLVVFLVQDEKVKVEELKISPADLGELVKRYTATSASDPELSRRLYRELLEPIAEQVSKQRVLIVPHGALHRLPFETLLGPAGFQVERWTISYLQSASLLRYLRLNSARGGGHANSSRPLKLLALADPDTDYDRDGKPNKAPLPAALKEVTAFAPDFRDCVVLGGNQARESEIAVRSRG
ncbi:MAG: CHAT domain-containing protein, partial [Planctomycetota bacterium]|nr:CHAT domain-containing protein [Planctomycetota bacterium]